MMSITRTLPVALILVTIGSSLPVRITPGLVVGYREQSGVETRLLFSGQGAFEFGPWLQALAAIQFASGDNPGIARYTLGASAVLLPAIKLGLNAQVNHDEWSYWETGENRVAVQATAEPLPGLQLAAGLAWRAPVFGATRYRSPFDWSSDTPEWNYLYRLDWTFLRVDNTTLAAWITDFDRFTIHNPQQVPFGLRATAGRGEHWRLDFRLGSAINGLSGGLLSLSELNLEAGADYEF